ncbi:MAG TPA: hypothetical protein VHG08_04115 [Longimicrobium sp.]|nr:hypothetical protein [Longimicrobium sp.]
MRTNTTLAALLAGMTALAGCGRELVGGGQRNVDAAATGDGTGSGSAGLAQRYAVAPGGGGVFQANGIGGTITFDARVYLVRNAQPVPLNGPATATVRADGRDTVAVASGRVPEVEYPTARVVFTRVTGNVTGGLVIGGVSLTGQVSVAIADSVVVERPVDLGDADDDATLLIDLDASAWLQAANPVTRIVPAAAFQGAVKLRRG